MTERVLRFAFCMLKHSVMWRISLQDEKRVWQLENSNLNQSSWPLFGMSPEPVWWILCHLARIIIFVVIYQYMDTPVPHWNKLWSKLCRKKVISSWQLINFGPKAWGGEQVYKVQPGQKVFILHTIHCFQCCSGAEVKQMRTLKTT